MKEYGSKSASNFTRKPSSHNQNARRSGTPLQVQVRELMRILKQLSVAEYNSVAISTAATMLDSSTSKIRRMIANGELDVWKLGREPRILVSSIADYVKRHRIGG